MHPGLFFNPEKSFHLPIYAYAMAHISINNLATLGATPWFVEDHRILQYLNLSTIEGDVVERFDSNGSNDQLSSSSHSASGCTSSSL
jgi:hypothetical protein